MALAEVLAAAPAEDFFWWSFLPGAAAAAAFFGCWIFLRRERLIQDTPTARIRSAAQGFCEFEGRARLMDGPPIVAPLTGLPCVWWRYRIEQRRTDSRGRTSWDTVEHRNSDECFLLDDDSGQCVVDPDGAQVIPSGRDVWYGALPRPDTGPKTAGFLGSWAGDYRYTEDRLLPRDALYALGAFRTQRGDAEVFDDKADLTELLDKWKHDKRMMALLDVNKDGQVDQKEWEAARRMALDKVRAAQVQRAVQTPDLNVLARPADGRPFILSGVPQAQLIRRFRFYSAGCIALFFGAGGFTVYALAARGLL